MIDYNIPFSNNLAEQIMRMMKVKQKISGGFRIHAVLTNFYTIETYLTTLQKQDVNLFDALIQTFKGTPTPPRFT